MIVGIIGSHGTGKTSTINEIKKIYPQWIYINEATRNLIPILGYRNPYTFIEDYNISYYECLMFGYWSIIDKNQNPLLKSNNITIITDRSPIDNLAYYYLHRKDNEFSNESYLERLCNHYANLYDIFFYIPIKFKIQNSEMQPLITQKKMDGLIKSLLKKYNIPYKCESRVKKLVK